MGNSIQDYLKKINSSLSVFDAASIVITAVLLVLCSLYIAWLFRERQSPVLYESGYAAKESDEPSTRPFGSKKGTTYTYSWCQGGNVIKPENKIYYESAEAAESAGRRLSKLCEN